MKAGATTKTAVTAIRTAAQRARAAAATATRSTTSSVISARISGGRRVFSLSRDVLRHGRACSGHEGDDLAPAGDAREARAASSKRPRDDRHGAVLPI